MVLLRVLAVGVRNLFRLGRWSPEFIPSWPWHGMNSGLQLRARAFHLPASHLNLKCREGLIIGGIAEVMACMVFSPSSTTNLEINEWVKVSQFVYF